MKKNQERMLNSICNAIRIKREFIMINYSTENIRILNSLQNKGFIRKFNIMNKYKKRSTIKIYLKYDKFSDSVINELKILYTKHLQISFKEKEVSWLNKDLMISFTRNSFKENSSGLGLFTLR